MNSIRNLNVIPNALLFLSPTVCALRINKKHIGIFLRLKFVAPFVFEVIDRDIFALQLKRILLQVWNNKTKRYFYDGFAGLWRSQVIKLWRKPYSKVVQDKTRLKFLIETFSSLSNPQHFHFNSTNIDPNKSPFMRSDIVIEEKNIVEEGFIVSKLVLKFLTSLISLRIISNKFEQFSFYIERNKVWLGNPLPTSSLHTQIITTSHNSSCACSWERMKREHSFVVRSSEFFSVQFCF